MEHFTFYDRTKTLESPKRHGVQDVASGKSEKVISRGLAITSSRRSVYDKLIARLLIRITIPQA